MITNYFTLRALVEGWRADLVGCRVGDVYSQTRGELTIALVSPEAEWMVRCSTRSSFHFLFRTAGYSRARRNVATLFEEAFDRRVVAVEIAERDRLVTIALDEGLAFRLMLFGPRANVFLVDAGGQVLEAFQASGDWEGRAAPEARPASEVERFEAFEARWRPDRKSTEQAVASAFPLFDRTLAAETIYRAGVTAATPAEVAAGDRRALFEAAVRLRAELEEPDPRVYWRGRFPELFALRPLRHLADPGAAPGGVALEEERFASVDEGVRVFVKRSLAEERFRRRYEPAERALREAASHYRRSAENMLEELTRESRAERYEQWGHLLMAGAADVPAGRTEIVLPDLFGDGETEVTIPLDPARSALENARAYYDRARRTRRSREEAESRLLETERRAEEARTLLEALEAVRDYAELDAFFTERADRLAPYLAHAAPEEDRIPFRRFALPQGYEVWVGRNARQNDDLTFHHAQKYDLWMHARGVPGSHTVLRLPNRQARPAPAIVERAASIAAYFSKARGSGLVPVMVTERKYVRKPRGAAPGAVAVEREEVLLVEPRLPEDGR